MGIFSYWARAGLLALLGWGLPGPVAPPPAAASGPPLLVVVETGPGAGCDPEAVRAAIAAELGERVLAPTAPPSAAAVAGPRTDVLLVAVDRARIVVTLRGQGDREVTRSVAAPAERAAKLRIIAWLAANVARDQLATLSLPQAPPEVPQRSPEVAASPPVAAPEAAADAPGEAVPPATAPPAFRPPVAAPAGGTTGPELSLEVPGWTFTLVGGRVAIFHSLYQQGWDTPVSWSVAGQLEAHRDMGDGDWFVGAALDVGPLDTHPLGAALLLGAQAGIGQARLEGSIGLGAEAFVEKQMFIDEAPSSRTRRATYLRGAVTVSYPIAGRWDAVAQLGAHLTAGDAPNTAFGLGALGLRLNLPSAPGAAPRAARSRPIDMPAWTLTLSGGIAASFDTPWLGGGFGPQPGGVPWSAAGDVEVHRHLGAWFVGVAGDLGPRPYHQIGGALLLGKQTRVGRVRLEGSGGLGVEQHVERIYSPTAMAPTDPFAGHQDIITARGRARLAVAGTLPVAPQVEAVAQLVSDLTITDKPNGGFVLAAAGVRLTLP